jgi:ABC-type sugar transport system ATPase subunit
MTTIILRHVTKQYVSGETHDEGSLDRMATSTARLLDAQTEPHSGKAPAEAKPSDRINVLNDISLTIRSGETLGIIGPSGCGKTTLLKVIAGLLKPDSGEILYDGVPITEIPMAERGIGMVFQGYALYPHMPARDNIGFYDLIRRQPERIPERIRQIVQVMGVDIRHLLSRKPPTLSGGEQQRIAVARCLARDPKIFLFDEPLSNLDAHLRLETRVQLHRLIKHYQITSVYVTHDQTEAIALADRIAIMQAGSIEQVGSSRALYDTPRNAFVADFFGTPPMNLFSGYVWGDTWEGKGFTVSPVRPGLQQGQGVWIGIRPEHVQITETGIPAEIEIIEPLLTQSRQLIYTTIRGQRCIISTGLDIAVKQRETIHLQFPSEYLYFFDRKTNARIG